MPFYNFIVRIEHFAAQLCRTGLVTVLPLVFAQTVVAATPVQQPATRLFVPPSRNEVLIRQYLYEAEDALAHDRLTSPRNDNALAGYQRVLALDPRNEKARSGIKLISRRYLSMAKKAEQDSDFERALGYARQAQRMAPGYEGSSHMVKHLEQRKAAYDAQQMQIVKAGGASAQVTLKSKGNEYFLAAGDVSRRNFTAKAQLAQIAEKAKNLDSRLLILARNDGDGRWIYSQMRDSLTTDYRLRANIRVDSQTRIVLLDQPLESAVQAAPAPATIPTPDQGQLP
jgi:hypothetical protein